MPRKSHDRTPEIQIGRGLSSHPVGVEFSPLKQIYSPVEKDHYVNTTVEHYGNVFVHKGGKLENRFLAKMHQIAPNGVSNFKNFPGGDTIAIVWSCDR